MRTDFSVDDRFYARWKAIERQGWHLDFSAPSAGLWRGRLNKNGVDYTIQHGTLPELMFLCEGYVRTTEISLRKTAAAKRIYKAAEEMTAALREWDPHGITEIHQYNFCEIALVEGLGLQAKSTYFSSAANLFDYLQAKA